MIDEDGLAAFDHPAHRTVGGRYLHHSLDHLDGTALLVDHHGEGRSLDHGGEHRRVDREVGDAGMPDLEQHGAEILDHAREAVGLRRRRQPKLAMR